MQHNFRVLGIKWRSDATGRQAGIDDQRVASDIARLFTQQKQDAIGNILRHTGYAQWRPRRDIAGYQFNIAYVLVLVWAFVGIAVKHSGTPLVAWTAAGLAGLLALSIIGAVIRRRQIGATATPLPAA